MKNIIPLIVYLLGSLILSSCASSIKRIEPTRSTYTSISLNTIIEKEIGESLIDKGVQEVYKAIKVLTPPEKKIWSNGNYIYTKGEIYPLLAYNKGYDLYFHKSSITESKTYHKGNQYTTFSFYGICQSKKDSLYIQPFVRQTTGYLGGLTTKYARGFEVESTEYIDISCDKCFKQEFIFNGKVGNSLKFIYREYVDDFIRPAFTQDLQYDLSESDIIGFKGLRLQVIEANNTRIKYQVLKSFD